MKRKTQANKAKQGTVSKNLPLINGEALDFGIGSDFWMGACAGSRFEFDAVLYHSSFHPTIAHSASEPLVELASSVGRSRRRGCGKNIPGQHESEGRLDQLPIDHRILGRNNPEFDGADFLQLLTFSRLFLSLCVWNIRWLCHPEKSPAN